MSATYGSLREKIAAEKAERLARYAGFEALVTRAHLAGVEAARAAVPAPMVVTTSAGEVIETVWDGPCGFAWVVIRDGRSSFGRWASKQGIARKAYGGGIASVVPVADAIRSAQTGLLRSLRRRVARGRRRMFRH